MISSSLGMADCHHPYCSCKRCKSSALKEFCCACNIRIDSLTLTAYVLRVYGFSPPIPETIESLQRHPGNLQSRHAPRPGYREYDPCSGARATARSHTANTSAAKPLRLPDQQNLLKRCSAHWQAPLLHCCKSVYGLSDGSLQGSDPRQALA